MWRAWRDNTKRVAHDRLVALLHELHGMNLGDDDGYVYADELRLPSYAATIDLRFSLKAGCSSCPCSPGFVMGGLVRHGYKPQDIWIATVSELVEVSA